MPSVSKLFNYLFYKWREYDVTFTFMTLMSCDSVCCMCGEAWSSRWLMTQFTSSTIPRSYIRVRAVVWECGEGQTDTQTNATSIHFASATPHAKCKKGKRSVSFAFLPTTADYVWAAISLQPCQALAHQQIYTYTRIIAVSLYQSNCH